MNKMNFEQPNIDNTSKKESIKNTEGNKNSTRNKVLFGAAAFGAATLLSSGGEATQPTTDNHESYANEKSKTELNEMRRGSEIKKDAEEYYANVAEDSVYSETLSTTTDMQVFAEQKLLASQGIEITAGVQLSEMGHALVNAYADYLVSQNKLESKLQPLSSGIEVKLVDPYVPVMNAYDLVKQGINES